MTTLLDITDAEFKKISELVYKNFGINLTDKKKALVKGRLNKVVRKRGFNSFEEYYNAILDDTKGELLIELINKISTNHTFFFRENSHFEILSEEVLPMLLKTVVPDDLRVWCAGCATGEEAYSLAITLYEAVKDKGQFKGHVILATDISLKALNAAKEGIYSKERLRAIDQTRLFKYFQKLPDGTYKVKPILQELVLFRRLNFLDSKYPFKNKFHFIFCRNVMIYFDTPTKDQLIQKFANVIQKNGYLFIGHSETLGRDQQLFKYKSPAVYERHDYG